MQRFAIFALAAVLTPFLAPLPARTGEVFRGEGATLRLIATPPGPDKQLRAALRVELEPGWKTYWLEPGDAGIPPGLDFGRSTGLADLAAILPAPVRFREGEGSSSIGYLASFSVAIEGSAVAPGPRTLDVRVTLGLCRELCVPVTAELALDLAAATDTGEVAAAFAALPRASGAEAGIASLVLAPDLRELRAEIRPASLGAAADLFVAASGWVFGAPVSRGDGQLALPVLRKPRKADAPARAEALLVSKNGPFRATLTIGRAGG